MYYRQSQMTGNYKSSSFVDVQGAVSCSDEGGQVPSSTAKCTEASMQNEPQDLERKIFIHIFIV